MRFLICTARRACSAYADPRGIAMPLFTLLSMRRNSDALELSTAGLSRLADRPRIERSRAASVESEDGTTAFLLPASDSSSLARRGDRPP